MDRRTYERTAQRNVLYDKICRLAPPAPWQKKDADRASLPRDQAAAFLRIKTNRYARTIALDRAPMDRRLMRLIRS